MGYNWDDPVESPKPVIVNPKYTPKPAESLQQAIHWKWNKCDKGRDERIATERICRQVAATKGYNVIYIKGPIHNTTGNEDDGIYPDGPHITAIFCRGTLLRSGLSTKCV